MLIFSAFGNWGERAAATFLRRTGYTTLSRNWRRPFAELDIVAKKDGILVFAEVKQRKWSSFGTPGQAVDSKKQRKIKAAAQAYMAKNKIKLGYTAVRFDVVEVRGEKGKIFSKCEINHIENAF